MGEFPLHCRSFQRAGQFQAEPLEQDLLVLGGLADAAFADRRPGSGRQHHVHQRDLGEGLENLPRFVAQSRFAATRGQSFPEHVGQEANQDVRLYAVLPSDATRAGSPDRTCECERPPRPRSTGCKPATDLPDSNPSHCCATRSSLHSSAPTRARLPPSTSRKRAKPPASASTFTSNSAAARGRPARHACRSSGSWRGLLRCASRNARAWPVLSPACRRCGKE